jgi:hypothetical protein
MNTIKSLDNLLGLPRKILHNHGVDGLAQIVLHELGHHDSFGINRASYLIDNPDFGCMRGVAGYANDECVYHQSDIWNDPTVFARDMQKAKFHGDVAKFLYTNLKRTARNDIDEKAVNDVGHMLGMHNPLWLTWPMQHGNHGILLFEQRAQAPAHHRDIFNHFAPLLSLC